MEQTLKETEALDFSESKAAQKQYNQIVSWTREQFTMIKNARVATERQWYMNMAMYFGKQNVVPLNTNSPGSASTTRFWVPPAPYWRARPVINRVRPTVRTELSQLTGNKPNASIVPASAEDRDMYAAMAGEQIWNNFYTEKKIKSIIRKSMWWALICGTGFMKSYWDPMVGPKEAMVNEAGEVAEIPQGDVVFCHETPFHILVPDFREEELENQPYLLHAQVKSKDYVQMKFRQALDGKEVNAQTTEVSEILEDSFLNLIGAQSMTNQQSTLVLEVWIKPGSIPMFPQGAFITLVGDQIVQGFQGWPYRHGKFPFAKLDHIPSGKFYGTSVIEDLIPLQKEYNRTRGQIIENKNRMAKVQLIAPRGSVDASKITSEPGQVIQYTPGFDPPQPLPLQPLPQYVTEELDRLLMDWNDISGQHEVTQGQMPPGVTAATAISFLQERDESKLSPTFDSLEEGIEKIAQMSLSYVNEFWDTERMIKVTGPEGSFDTMALKGSDLDNNLDIRVEAGSALPVSKAAKQALIMDMMKMGFIEPRKGLEVMDMGGINKLYEQFQVDQRQAQRENLRMSKVTAEMLQQYNQQNMMQLEQDPTAFDGIMPPLIVPVNNWDNHKLHIEYHNNYRKSQAFEVLGPEVKALFDAHVMGHIQALGIETVTMDPRMAAGLPPDPMMGEEEEEEQEQPGPEPMPETELGV